ncbi:MAG: alpha/beta fold hydrolase [Ilumatobacteraceae bacterium]
MSARGVWYTRTGPQGAPQMVMVHGSLDRSTGLSRLARRFDDRYEVLRLDRRGYGKSGDHNGPFTVSENVDDLVDLIEQEFPTGPLVLIGHSFGGNIVLAASGRLGSRVTRIATYEMPMSWQPWWGGNSSKGFPEQNPEDSAEAFMRRLVGNKVWERLPERTKTARRAEGRVLVGELSDLRSGPPWQAEDVVAPVLALSGSRAAEHHRRAVQFLEETLPNCRSVEIDGAGHGGPNSHPEEVSEAIQLFIDQPSSAGRS